MLYCESCTNPLNVFYISLFLLSTFFLYFKDFYMFSLIFIPYFYDIFFCFMHFSLFQRYFQRNMQTAPLFFFERICEKEDKEKASES